jgi:putative Holliday junction resolvase
MTRLMALDVGAVRIGIAISDSNRFLASPYTTVYVSRDETATWAAISRLIDETEAAGLVIGLPVSLDGQIHAQGERVLAFAERLKQHITIPVAFWDERLSTVEAQRLLAERNQQEKRRSGGQRRMQTRRRQKGHEIDALAAAVILQEYLDSLGSKAEETLL